MPTSMLLLLMLLGANTPAPAAGAYLGELTWPQAEVRLREAPLVIVPFGAGAKEHGPHLPMNADQVLMEHLVAEAVRALPVVAAPPILHGWFPAFRGFPGTEISEPAVFQDYVFQVAESLVRNGARRVVFLNTGIARATGLPIAIAAREIRARYGVPTLVVSWDDLETSEVAAFQKQSVGGHADEIETSIALVLQPGRVRMEHAVRDDGRPANPYPGYRPGAFGRAEGDADYSRTGLRGDPTLATPETGRQALAIMTRNWLSALRGFAAEPIKERPEG